MRYKKIQKLFALCVICLVLVNMFSLSVSAENNDFTFQGTRCITYLIDYSDIEGASPLHPTSFLCKERKQRNPYLLRVSD